MRRRGCAAGVCVSSFIFLEPLFNACQKANEAPLSDPQPHCGPKDLVSKGFQGLTGILCWSFGGYHITLYRQYRLKGSQRFSQLPEAWKVLWQAKSPKTWPKISPVNSGSQGKRPVRDLQKRSAHRKFEWESTELNFGCHLPHTGDSHTCMFRSMLFPARSCLTAGKHLSKKGPKPLGIPPFLEAHPKYHSTTNRCYLTDDVFGPLLVSEPKKGWDHTNSTTINNPKLGWPSKATF